MLNRRTLLCCVVLASLEPVVQAETNSVENLSRADCLARVLLRNETLQMRELEWRISQKRASAEKGLFEPAFVGSYQHQFNHVETTSQQQTSSGGVPYLDEKNNLYTSGVDFVVPTGAKIHVGYNIQELRNNIPVTGFTTNGLPVFDPRPFQTFAGISLTQPLLKDGGVATTTAAIRLAAGESEIAYQEYRRQMMIILAQAQSAYWDLYYFQELERLSEESVGIAQTVYTNAQVRTQAGKASSIDVMQAESGLALREAKRNDARHKRYEAMNHLSAFVSGATEYKRADFHATDRPEVRDLTLDYASSMYDATRYNPNYLTQRKEIQQSNIRLAFARNQRWPQLDLTASYGLNGLAHSVSASFDDMQTGHWETWSVGVQLRIPLGGGIKTKNELDAARMRQQEALLGLKAAEVDISTGVDTSIHRISGLRDSIADFQKAADYNQKLFEAESSKLDVGMTDNQRVLATEEDLSEAKRAVLEALVAYEKAILEWELGKGTLLQMSNHDYSRSELKHRLLSELTGIHVGSSQSEGMIRDAARHYADADRLRREDRLDVVGTGVSTNSAAGTVETKPSGTEPFTAPTGNP